VRQWPGCQPLPRWRRRETGKAGCHRSVGNDALRSGFHVESIHTIGSMGILRSDTRQINGMLRNGAALNPVVRCLARTTVVDLHKP
jgi:hypothetical protein